MRTALGIVGVLLALVCLALIADASIPREATEAHEYADGVLQPRFVAAVNDWAYQHPQDRPGHLWEHCQVLDAGDVKRWQKVRETWRELDRAYKRAGY